MLIKKKLILWLLVSVGILFIPVFEYHGDNETIKETENKPIFLKCSYFNISCEPIFINGTGGNDWNWAETQAWCTKIGNTYYIENLTINGQNSLSCIDIRDSMEFFIIRNCTLYNSSVADAGIYLSNVENGQVIDNNCSNNNWFGLEMISSNNITISENIFYNNLVGGVALQEGTNNIIENNTFDDNDTYGMRCLGIIGCNITENHFLNSLDAIILLNSGPQNSQQNLVSNNFLYNNSRDGIYMIGCNNNNLTSNSIYNNNGTGILLESNDDFNLIINNLIYENNADGIYLKNSCTDNEFRNNSIQDNSQNGIRLENDCNFNDIINNSIHDNGRGIFLDLDCDRNLIFNNEIYGSSIGSDQNTGILLAGTSNSCDFNNISENLIYNHSQYAIHFPSNCNNNSIFNNIIRDNENYGIFIEGDSTYNDFLQNTITNSSIGFVIHDSNYNKIRGNYINNNSESIKINGTSTGNILNFNEIDDILEFGFIDDDEQTFGAFIWEEMVNFWWCSGNGESSNPYIIENITINGLNSTSCIKVDNSQNYFVIRNSTLLNSSSGIYDAGIRLINVSNGVIYNNTIYNNARNGICMEVNCDYNEIIDNNIRDNQYHGISIHQSCDYNNISDNFIFETIEGYVQEYGIHINGSESNPCMFNNISRNIIKDNNGCGSMFYYCYNTTIYNNTIVYNGGNGISLYSYSSNNTLKQNIIISNECNGIDIYYYSFYNKLLENSIKNNTHNGIRISDHSNFIFILDNIISYNDLNGISILDSNNSLISGNTANFNKRSGLELQRSCLTKIINNIKSFNNNTECGIFLNQSHCNNITGNQIYNNPTGVWLNGSNNNRVLNNIFSGNEVNINETFCVGNLISEGSDGDGVPDDDFLFIIIIIIVLGITIMLVLSGLYFKRRKKIILLDQERQIPKLIEDEKGEITSAKNDVKPLVPSMSKIEIDHKKVKKTEDSAAILDISEEEEKDIQEVEEEMQIETQEFTCIVHKGLIEGDIYLCPHCKTFYCQKCVTALRESSEKCWSCHKDLK